MPLFQKTAPIATIAAAPRLSDKGGPWVDLALTLPIFLVYHLGVVFLDIRNSADLITAPLMRFADGNRALYIAITFAIGLALVGTLSVVGRGQAFRPSKFVQILVEGIVYAVAMRLIAGHVVENYVPRQVAGLIELAPSASAGGKVIDGPFAGLVMSFGAGFYEEIAFRVVLFGLLGRAALRLTEGTTPSSVWRTIAILVPWAIAAAAIFSGIHYIGALGESFRLGSFVFRLMLGLVLTLIYVTRGFAAAVWTHALYDVWVLVF